MTSMNTRHAAALALMGWYLMVPPVHQERSGEPLHLDSNAPISRWEVDELAPSGYDTVAKCDQDLDHLRDHAEKRADNSPNDAWLR
jgi:hypothetical protein